MAEREISTGTKILNATMGFIFPSKPAQKKGMPEVPEKQAAAPVPPKPAGPTMMPPLDTNSPQNIDTVVDDMVAGKR